MRVNRLIDRAGAGLLIPLMVLVLVFLIAPFLLTALLSFDSRSFLGPLPPPGLSLRWYERFMSDAYLLAGLRTSLIVACTVTVISAAVGLATAIAFRRWSGPGRETMQAFLLSPLIVPPVVLGFGLLLTLASLDIGSGLIRLIAGHLIITVPYTIRASILSVAAVRPVYEEAAMSLGATRAEAFRTITLPLARSGILVGCIFSFVVSMDDVAVSMFLSTPDRFTLPVALMSSMRASFDLSIAAASTLFTLIVLFAVLLLERALGLSSLFGNANGRA